MENKLSHSLYKIASTGKVGRGILKLAAASTEYAYSNPESYDEYMIGKREQGTEASKGWKGLSEVTDSVNKWKKPVDTSVNPQRADNNSNPGNNAKPAEVTPPVTNTVYNTMRDPTMTADQNEPVANGGNVRG